MYEEDTEMSAGLLTTWEMGMGDCTPEDGEWAATATGLDECAAECMAHGQRWMSINQSGHCYCEYEEESAGGCESNTGSDYYTNYKSFQGEMIAQGQECSSSGGEEWLGNMSL